MASALALAPVVVLLLLLLLLLRMGTSARPGSGRGRLAILLRSLGGWISVGPGMGLGLVALSGKVSRPVMALVRIGWMVPVSARRARVMAEAWQ